MRYLETSTNGRNQSCPHAPSHSHQSPHKHNFYNNKEDDHYEKPCYYKSLFPQQQQQQQQNQPDWENDTSNGNNVSNYFSPCNIPPTTADPNDPSHTPDMAMRRNCGWWGRGGNSNYCAVHPYPPASSDSYNVYPSSGHFSYQQRQPTTCYNNTRYPPSAGLHHPAAGVGARYNYFSGSHCPAPAARSHPADQNSQLAKASCRSLLRKRSFWQPLCALLLQWGWIIFEYDTYFKRY